MRSPCKGRRLGAVVPGAVVVLNWNRGDATLPTLDAVMATKGVKFHLIVVDNGSTDGSVDLFRSWAAARRLPMPVIKPGTPAAGHCIVANPTNDYYAGGNNVGIQAAWAMAPDWILILNNDVILRPETIGHLLECGTVAGPMVATPDGKVLSRGMRRSFVRGGLANVGIGETIESPGSPGGPVKVEGVEGSCMLVPAAVLADVGLLDEGYGMYWEDADWCARMQRAGHAIHVAPTVVTHDVSSSGSGVSTTEWIWRNRWRYLRLHRPWWWRAAFMPWYLLVYWPAGLILSRHRGAVWRGGLAGLFRTRPRSVVPPLAK